MNRPWVRWLLLLGAASPALIPLVLIVNYSVDIPYWDQWDHDFAGMYVKAHQGQLAFADLAAQHNEHRPLVPRVIELGLNSVTHWNTTAELVFQWLVVLATSVGILLLDYSNSRDSDAGLFSFRALFAWFLANLLIFSPMQLEVWLWGMGLPIMLPMFFTVAALLAARSRLPDWGRTTLVIICCSAATYSVGNGALSWGLAGALLLWSRSWEELKSKRWIFAALAGALVVNLLLYFIGFDRNQGSTGRLLPASTGEALDFFISFLGSMFRFSTNFSVRANTTLFGIVMLTMLLAAVAYFIYARRKRRDVELSGRLLLWLAVAGFAVFSGLLGAMMRSGQGPSGPLQARYIAYSLYLPLALIYLVRLVMSGYVPAVLATLLVFGWIQQVPLSFKQAGMVFRERVVTKASVMLLNVLPDNPYVASLVFPRPQVVRELAPVLNQMHYFRPPMIESPNVKLLSDGGTAAGQLERGWQATGSSFAISGWAEFPGLNRAADVVLVCYNDSHGDPIIFEIAPVGQERQDLVQEMKNDALRFSGWSAEIPMGQFASLKSITFSAWAFNVATGKAYPLEGAATINR